MIWEQQICPSKKKKHFKLQGVLRTPCHSSMLQEGGVQTVVGIGKGVETKLIVRLLPIWAEESGPSNSVLKLQVTKSIVMAWGQQYTSTCC